MGQALYRAYRPKTLSEIVGQEHVTTTLSNALKSGRISHAYLLTGPRGTGKTSIARILAHEINGIPYDDAAHLDIIEIDAASNRRIDEIRELRDRVTTAPASAKYKVYIIDEVHMLTKEAFNALLKTLEEPPAHVIFILATTEAHKLPETIISRTQRYSFRPVPIEQVVNLLKSIAKKEQVAISDEALTLIAEHGEGSLRDSISLLDQASNSNGKISRIDIARILGLAPDEYIINLQQALQTKQSSDIIATIASLYAGGYEPTMIAAQLSSRLRQAVLDNTLPDSYYYDDALKLLRQLIDVPAARQPKQLLELILLQASLQQSRVMQTAVISAIKPKPDKAIKQPVVVPPTTTTMVLQPKTEIAPLDEKVMKPVAKSKSSKISDPVAKNKAIPSQIESVSSEPTPAIPTDSEISEAEVRDLWQQTLDVIKKQYNTLYGMARMGVPELHGNELIVYLKFAFHQKRINEIKNRQILGDAFSKLSGRHIEINCVVADKSLVAAAGSGKPADVTDISNIFGGAELLES